MTRTTSTMHSNSTMNPVSNAPDYEAIKAKQQATWASGDYSVVGATLQLVQEALCEAVDLRPGQRVIDVATGNGGAALAAARRFTEVVGVDYVPSLLERGRARAAAERFAIDFREGDAERLEFADASFDVALSTFGVMFTANHAKAASELARVVRRGGKIGLACWTPEGVLGESFRVIAKYAPPAPGIESAMAWGTEAYLKKLFGGAAMSIEFQRRTHVFRFRSFEHFLDLFRTYYGPMHKTFAALDGAKQTALTNDLREMLERWNVSGDATLVYPGEYLEAVIVRA